MDCRSIWLKDGMIEAVDNLLEHWTAAKQTVSVGDLICSEQGV